MMKRRKKKKIDEPKKEEEEKKEDTKMETDTKQNLQRDFRNLIHFLKNTSKYDTPDLRNVVISKLLKDTEKAFENEQMIDLSEEELYNIMTKRPQVAGRKVMDVLIRWVKKSFALEDPKVEKKEEAIEETKEEKKVEEVKDVAMTEEKKEETKKDEEKKDDEKKEEEKN